MKKLLIIGAGGQGRVVADIISRLGSYELIAFLDDMQPDQSFPYPYLGKSIEFERYLNEYDFFVAIGNGKIRRQIIDSLMAKNAQIATVVAAEAVVSSDVPIGIGTVIMPGAVVNTGAKIGKGVIINTSSSVDHDCVVDDYCHIAVGAHVCGTVNVGAQTWIGAGATVINNINICSGCTIAAGAVVVKNITDAGIYMGVPARRKSEL